jgi:hypothetical protein
MGTFHEDVTTFLKISGCIIFRMRNVLDKRCKENQNTHFMFNNFFFFRKLHRLWDKVEKCDGEQGDHK